MNTERTLGYFGAAVIGALLLVLAILVGSWTHEVRISFGRTASGLAQSSIPYVQLPTCYSHAQCAWLHAAPASLSGLTIDYEADCDSTPLDGRILKPTHAELNWLANKSTTTQLCPNF
jgi:hypothetical protein